ncbi:DUF3566 domain-containing protein [Nocardioides sp. LMS-CY]|uniref:DUF3566 domain-containing protein n=1 Tax=Nocardioides soli TaxID=1036020 RepID=A0A7W4W137_9ACTN|nr:MULTISPECIES: DUF3566 domain-containing protein [Nocardioides]MBB3045502.1 hypothetical protein [Nocardioides soli]QWF22188.1 DUF3566 domain-containing protein [Nocardioides sp. LMS-CY]
MTDRSAERTATRPPADRPSSGAPSGKSADRPGLGARISAVVGKASDEHRANANPASKAAATKASPAARPPRRARLRLTRIDPWSVMKTAFLLAIAFGVVTIVSVFIIWSVLSAAGVWDSINRTVQDVVGGQDASSWDVEKYVGMSRVMGFTMLVAVVDVILLTAIATLGAFLYNMAAALLGGVELTLAEDQR